MNNKRRVARKRPDVSLRVTDAMTGEVVGQLGNLSMDGMMLIAQSPINEDALYQFTFQLPNSYGQLRPIEVGAHQLWADAPAVNGQAWIGFRFIDVAPDDEEVLANWLMHAEDFEG